MVPPVRGDAFVSSRINFLTSTPTLSARLSLISIYL